MMIPKPKSIILFFILFLAMLLDGVLSAVLSAQFTQVNLGISTRLLLLLFIVASFFAPEFNLIIPAFILGYFYDSYYAGMIGIYLFLLPGIVYLVRKTRDFLTQNAFIIGAFYLIALTVQESAVFAIYHVTQMTKVSIQEFISQNLGPDLLLNLCLFIFLYFPLKQMLLKLTR